MVLEIEDLKTHKKVVKIHIQQVDKMLDNVVKEAEEIHNQTYMKFCKTHSDVLDLLEKYMLKDKDGIQIESFYECLQRLIGESSHKHKE